MVSHIQDGPELGLSYINLDKESLHLKVFSNSALANNRDNTSQLGLIILVTNNFSRCNILNYISRKSKRVKSSVHGGELHEFAGDFDSVYTIKYDFESIFGKLIPL